MTRPLIPALLVFCCCAACSRLPESFPPPAPQTRWVNDHGSELFIEAVAPDGWLTGTYSSSAPNFKCRNIAFLAQDSGYTAFDGFRHTPLVVSNNG